MHFMSNFPARTLFLVLALSVASHFVATTVRAEGPDLFKNRIVLLVEEGETIFLVPPDFPSGTSGALSRVRFGPVGSFETGLLSGEPLVPFLMDALVYGSAIAGPVGGTFSLPRGQIEDEHTAWITLSPEAPMFAEALGVDPENVAVLIVTAEGVITGGTGRYSGATGMSKLYLKVELPVDQSARPIALPIARTAQFVFEFDDPDGDD